MLMSTQALAEKYLTADEVQAQVVGNAMHAKHLFRDFDFTVYFDANGQTAYRRQHGTTTKTFYKFKGDKHCIFWMDADRCANILDNGDGTYTRVNKGGKKVVKWVRVVEGKDL